MSSDIEFGNHLNEVHGNLINLPWQCVLCDGYACDPAQLFDAYEANSFFAELFAAGKRKETFS